MSADKVSFQPLSSLITSPLYLIKITATAVLSLGLLLTLVPILLPTTS